MSGASLQQVLGYKTLSGVIKAVKPGVPRPLPEAFYAINKRVMGNRLEYKQVNGTRRVARQVDRQSPAQEFTPSGVSKKIAIMPSYKEMLSLDPHDLENLMSDDGMLQELGRDEIARQIEEIGQVLMNSQDSAVHLMLCGGGKLYFGSEGQLLPSSSGAVITVDASIPASNLNQGLEIDGSTAIVTASWGTAATSIMKQLNVLKTTALQRTGYPIDTAVYTDDIVGYMMANTEIQAIMQSNAMLTSSFESGVIPNGFANITNWVNGSSMMWQSDDGTVNSVLSGDNIAFLPAMERSWFENAEGSAFVPAGGVFDDAEGAVDALGVPVQGKYAYSWVTKNPVAAKALCGVVHLPVVKVPGAVYFLDVTP